MSRRPKPTDIRLLEGNKGRKKISENEPNELIDQENQIQEYHIRIKAFMFKSIEVMRRFDMISLS
jgi:hypothetical protein